MAFAVHCPECSSSLEVEDEHREWTVRCPHCRLEFRPAQAMAIPVDDDEPPRPKRRRRRQRGDPEKGAAAIAMPGFVLEVIAWLSALGTLAVCAVLIVIGTVQAQQPPPNAGNEDPPEVLIFVGFCLGIIAVPYYIAVAVGARKMRHLTSFKWGMTAAIMSIVAIVLFGLLALPIIGPGIWAVVVMSNDDVKAAFEKHEPKSRDDDDDD